MLILMLKLMSLYHHHDAPLQILASAQSLQLLLNIPTPSPMAGDHLNVAFHLKLRHMNEHYRILSHKPIWV